MAGNEDASVFTIVLGFRYNNQTMPMMDVRM